MKYRLTPGNGLFVLVLGIFIYTKMNPGNPKDDLGVGYILFFSIFVLLGDLFLQFMISNYKKLLLIESVGLPLIIILLLLA